MALAISPVAAPLLAASHPMAALLIRDFFSRLCHQIPSRSFVLYGSPAAVCVRCLGIYLGVAIGVALPRGQRWVGLRWFWFTLLLNLMDVALATLYGQADLPLLRFVFGLVLGLGAGGLLLSRRGCNRSMRAV